MEKIRSAKSFKNWAINFYGREDFWNDPRCIETYGKDQLSSLYGVTFKDENTLCIKNFNKNNIDAQKTYQRALNEANMIIETGNPDAIRGRTEQEIIESCIQGQYAEQYLLDNGFTDCNLKYHDLIDKNGLITEVKTSLSQYNLDISINKVKKSKWNKSKRIISFIVKGNEYILYKDELI